MLETSQTISSPGWEDVQLVPSSLPELTIDDLDTAVDLAGASLRAPFVIASMTGGHRDSLPINERLAAAAQEFGIAIGAGSQRAAIRDPSLSATYSVIRETAPDAIVMANIGVCQLVQQGSEPPFTKTEIEEAIGMVEAQFLIVHLNVVEELIQPEGDANMVGLLSAIEALVFSSPVPVVVKETGSGMTRETARVLADVGVSVIDVGGAGGTSFARIEAGRAKERGDTRSARIGATFGDWGVPTAAAILEVRGEGLPVIATGGIRSGLDAAKALVLGADTVGVGRPILTAATESYAAVVEEIAALTDELRMAMLLTGSRSIQLLRDQQPVLTGHIWEWARGRNLIA